MPSRHFAFRQTALVAVLVAMGCAPSSRPSSASPSPESAPEAVTVQPGAPGDAGRVLSGAEMSALPRPAYSIADVAFMQGMIPHHQQALEMTALVTDRTTDRAVRLVALRIELSQQDEINLMRGWLRQRNEDVPGEGEHGEHLMHAMMPGMLTPAEMETLRAARGAEFDRLFLTFMIKHHEGAVRMVTELFATNGGGQQSEIYQFASDVEADQQAEIKRMQQLLASR